MQELLAYLLTALEEIGETNPEMYDTVCRERMGDVIFHSFLKPTDGYVPPTAFGLYDAEADAKVQDVLLRYTAAASELATREGLLDFKSRLSAFQNGAITSETGGESFDDFFGWMDPDVFDENGVVISRR